MINVLQIRFNSNQKSKKTVSWVSLLSNNLLANLNALYTIQQYSKAETESICDYVYSTAEGL